MDDTKTIINTLDDLNFFKYIPEVDLEKVKMEVENNLKKRVVESECNDDLKFSDGRHLIIDPENLAEEGIVYEIENLRPLLEKLGVEIRAIKSEMNDNGTEYKVEVNDKEFIIYSEEDYEMSWHRAFTTFIDILNYLLESVDSNERFYGQDFNGYTNDGQIFLLTDELYKYLKTLDIRPEFRVYTSAEYRNTI